MVFRLKRDAFLSAKKFFHSSGTKAAIRILSDDDAQTYYTCYLLKYFIEGSTYMCLTNFDCSQTRVKELYAKRWRVETSFRCLKSDLNMECAHSMTPDAYIQEIEARILLDTLSMMSLPVMREVDSVKKTCKRSTYYNAVDRCLDLLYLMKVCSSQGSGFDQVVSTIRSYTGPFRFDFVFRDSPS